ncbi:hypothetical protein [Acinetobacter radioresistens]|uniref:hypothetical protein n=1 Tax=Acinetobacter radioresistens TaxID=40216 RepID=UPI00326715E6
MIKNMDSFKLSYVYFFPVVFFPFLNIYQFRNDPDIKSWLFINFLVSFTVILIPLFLTLSMMIAKVLYRDQDKNTEYRSIGLGLLCCTFLTGSNYYQFQKFTVGIDLSIDYYRMAIMISFLIACFISSLYFTLKYKKYSQKYSVDFNVKTIRFMTSTAIPFFISVTTFFVV